MSNGLGLVDFAIGLVNSIPNLPDGQMIFFKEIHITEELELILLLQFFFWLIKMTQRLVNVSSLHLA